jgi:hypothetical protein
MSKREKKEDDGHQTVGDLKTEIDGRSGQNEAEGKEKLVISPAESTEQPQERPSIRSHEEKPPTSDPESATIKPKTLDDAGSSVKVSPEREEIVPTDILEKGIIYFFYRPRVNVEAPHGMKDVSRSFFVMRPTPRGAKLEHGPIGDNSNCRLLLLPKKKFPTSTSEKDMGFVEKAGVTLKTLQDSLIAEHHYLTQTRGERTRPEARPYAEGVYAIISSGPRSSHLAYILTIPSEVGDVQHDFGLRSRGSFIIQTKNPKYPGPSYAQLPKSPEYPPHILEKFHDLRWIPTEPELLDYPNAQFLIIGAAQDELGKAAVAKNGSKDDDQEQPGEELEKFEDENEERVKSLKGDHCIYEDLGLDAKNYPTVPTTWEPDTQ